MAVTTSGWWTWPSTPREPERSYGPSTTESRPGSATMPGAPASRTGLIKTVSEAGTRTTMARRLPRAASRWPRIASGLMGACSRSIHKKSTGFGQGLTDLGVDEADAAAQQDLTGGQTPAEDIDALEDHERAM